MKLIQQTSELDGILADWRQALGADYTGYRNHCYRVLNFCLAFGSTDPHAQLKVSIAAAFHDLGVWVYDTLDYLDPSEKLASEYLTAVGLEEMVSEITCMIAQHHKISRYTDKPDWLVESFRRADWIDLLKGRRRFGLDPAFIQEVIETFPNAGFHRTLGRLTWRWMKSHPLKPMPMMRL